MLVLFQHVPRIQLTRAVFVVDGEVVADTEVDPCRLVDRCVFDWNLFLTRPLPASYGIEGFIRRLGFGYDK